MRVGMPGGTKEKPGSIVPPQMVRARKSRSITMASASRTRGSLKGAWRVSNAQK